MGKKHKKEKKHKKKVKKKRVSSSSSSSSSESEDCNVKYSSQSISGESKGETSQSREDWMTMTSMFKTQTREQWKLETGSSRTLKKLEEKLEIEKTNEAGSHALELNVHYKNGGAGIPSATVAKTSVTYDYKWLQRALERAKAQAKEESRSLEDIAKDRWGSLETFYKLLEDAKNKGDVKEDRPIETNEKKRYSWKDRRGNNYDKDPRSRSKDSDYHYNKYRTGRDQHEVNVKKYKEDRVYPRSDRRSSRSRSRDRSSSSKMKRHRSSSSSSGSSSSSSYSSKRKSEKDRHAHKEAGKERDGQSLMMKPPSDDESTLSSYRGSSSNRNVLSQKRSWRKPKQETDFNESTEAPDSAEPPFREPIAEPPVETCTPKTSEKTEKETTCKILSEKEMNILAAKITKAELLGNDELVKKLKAKLDSAREAVKSGSSRRGQAPPTDQEPSEELVILTTTDKTGFTRPVAESKRAEQDAKGSRGSKKPKASMFGPDGKRIAYFADDFNTDLRDMFENEKNTKVADEIAALKGLATCSMEKLSDDFDVDDLYEAKVGPKETKMDAEREKQRAIKEHQRTQSALDSCHFCFGNSVMKKHLIVAAGKKCYLSLPAHASIVEGHCLIAPLQHVVCGTQADEDVWEEMMSFRQALVRMFSAMDQDCIFFETATGFYRMPHMAVHCIPMPVETGELAPIYFKKAILECEEEWAVNKKLIDLKGRNARRALPKGLPYFWVDFGLSPGFAHVIEDERVFPKNFAQEIAGGMLEVDHTLLRRPKLEDFQRQCQKVLDFTTKFKPFNSFSSSIK